MQPWASSSSAKFSGSTSGNNASSIISSSLSAATKRVRSTLSAQFPPLAPTESKLYIFRTSDGISFRPNAAMFSLPLVLATVTRDWSTLEVEFASRLRLKGSSARPKSNVSSVGITGESNGPSARGVCSCDGACWAAARLVAFARAICSLRAADAFLNCGGDSADAAVCADVVDAAENRVSSPDAVVEDFWDVSESFLGVPDGVLLVFSAVGMEGFLNRPFTGGRAWLGRAATALGPMGDAAVKPGFSGLGVLERGIAMPGDTILEGALAFSPTLEGLRMRVLGIRPRAGVLSIGGSGDLKRLFVRTSWPGPEPGPELEPGLLRDCGIGGGWELSERRLDPGLSPRLLTGLDVDPDGSFSKKLDMETLLFRAGVEGRCDSVSIVLSANDGRGGFNVLPRIVSSPAQSSSTGLFCECESLDAPPFDMLVILGVRFLFKLVCETHCDEGLFLKPGSFVEGCWSPGEACSGKLPRGSRGSRDMPLAFVGLGSFGVELNVGRLETGRGLARVFALFEVVFVVEVAYLALLTGGGGMLARLLMPKLDAAARRSLEATGRKRMLRPSPGPPPFPAKLSFDCDGRIAVDLGVGRRDSGRGRPLVFPGGSLFSSIVASTLLVSP